MSTLDIDTVQAFLLVAELQSFTRAAEALGTTQAAVSMKLQRLESVVGKRLVERSPRAVALTAAGAAFLPNGRALMEAHDRALSGETPARQQLSLGISDHAAGPELVPLLERLHAMSADDNRIVLPLAGISRMHARLVRTDSSIRLVDAGSKNGLQFGGTRVDEVTLGPGVVVHAGSVALSLEDGPTSDLEVGLALTSAEAASGHRASGGSRRQAWSISGRLKGYRGFPPRR